MEKETITLTDKEYRENMITVYELMNKGEAALTDSELGKLRKMALATEKYENEVLGLRPIKQPQSLTEVVELFMFENKLSQAKLADKLGIGKPKLSQILTGKRQPDVPFLKSLYNKLNIDPKFILEHI